MSTPESMPPVPPMVPENPYAAPQSEILASSGLAGTPAGRGTRLVAQIIDGLILLPVNLVLTWMLVRVDQDAVDAAIAAGDIAAAAQAATPSFFMSLLTSLIGIVALIAINWKFLPQGQTIGKKVMKIQIQSRNGGLLPVNFLITRRMLPVYLVALIPFIGPFIVLVDVLCIFREGRNTLHDDLANSKVVAL